MSIDVFDNYLVVVGVFAIFAMAGVAICYILGKLWDNPGKE